MKPQEIRALTTEQLREELEKMRREVFNLRFRAVTRQLANPHQVGQARRDVARFLTALRQQQRATPPAQEG